VVRHVRSRHSMHSIGFDWEQSTELDPMQSHNPKRAEAAGDPGGTGAASASTVPGRRSSPAQGVPERRICQMRLVLFIFVAIWFSVPIISVSPFARGGETWVETGFGLTRQNPFLVHVFRCCFTRGRQIRAIPAGLATAPPPPPRGGRRDRCPKG